MAMTHEQMLAFVHKQTKLALEHVQHFDAGGAVTTLGGPSASYGSGGGAANPNSGILGTINGALGLNNNYAAGAANTQAGTNAAQLNDAYTGVQGGLTQQQGLVQQTAPLVQQGLNTQDVLADQLRQNAAGYGPNPAQAALNQSTGQNVANQAALLASQRGAGANAGLTAEAAARAGGNIQQQAVGQAATLQAQQQIAAQQQQQALAAQEYGQGAAAIQGVNNAQQGEQGVLQGANTAYNNAQVAQQSNINNVNAQTAAANQGMAGKTLGGILSGASSALSSIGSMFAKGGMVSEPDQPYKKMASGGYLTPTPLIVNQGGPQSFVGQWLNSSGNMNTAGPNIEQTQPLQNQFSGKFDASGINSGQKRIPSGEMAGGGSDNPSDLSNDYNKTGQDSYGNNSDIRLPAYRGGLMKDGGAVEAHGAKEKAKVDGDSLKNDKIPAMLSQGEGVIDRETMNDPGPIGQMARSLMKHVESKKKRNGKK